MSNLAWPDAEAIAIDYLDGLLTGVAVTNRVPSDGVLAPPLVTVRRAGGVRQGHLFDQARLAVAYYAATWEDAADGMALVRDLLRQMVGEVGGFRVSAVSEFLGPTPVQDPDTQTPRLIMTVEALIRANDR